MNLRQLDDFTLAYLDCALWSSTLEPCGDCGDCGAEDQLLCRWNEQDEYVCIRCSDRQPNYEPPADENYDLLDLSPELLERAVYDCKTFQEAAGDRILSHPHRAGRHFWWTRNGHGAGFWDGDWPEEDGEFLTELSQRFGEIDLYVGDDQQIYAA
jgi:hypothetical protein